MSVYPTTPILQKHVNDSLSAGSKLKVLLTLISTGNIVIIIVQDIIKRFVLVVVPVNHASQCQRLVKMQVGLGAVSTILNVQTYQELFVPDYQHPGIH